MKSITVKFRFGKNLANWGKLIHKGGRTYEVWIDTTAPLWKIVGSIMHEIMHLVFYIFFAIGYIDDAREHRACELVDKASTRAMKRYLEGR